MIESRKTLLALSFLLILTLMVYCMLHVAQPNSAKTPQPEQVSLLSIRTSDLTQVEFASDSGVSTIFQNDDGWAWADGTVINSETADLMVTFLSYLYSDDVVKRGETDYVKYGLDPPQRIVAFETKEGERHVVEFGNVTATGKSVYMRLDGSDTVYTISYDAYDIIFNSLYQ